MNKGTKSTIQMSHHTLELQFCITWLWATVMLDREIHTCIYLKLLAHAATNTV